MTTEAEHPPITHENFRKLQSERVANYLERRQNHPSAFPGERGRSANVHETGSAVCAFTPETAVPASNNATDTQGGDSVATDNVTPMPAGGQQQAENNPGGFNSYMEKVRDEALPQWDAAMAGLAMYPDDIVIEGIEFKIKTNCKATDLPSEYEVAVDGDFKIKTSKLKGKARLGSDRQLNMFGSFVYEDDEPTEAAVDEFDDAVDAEAFDEGAPDENN